MGVERYVVEAVVRDGRSHRDVARSAGVSKAWVTKLLARYREGGDAALRWFSTSGDRHAGARLINLYAIAGIALVVIGSIGAVVMSTAAPYLIDQYQSTSPPGKQSIELVFRGAVPCRRRRDVADARNDSICRVAHRHCCRIRGTASRAVFWILLLIGRQCRYRHLPAQWSLRRLHGECNPSR